jgi:hypothetical protein
VAVPGPGTGPLNLLGALDPPMTPYVEPALGLSRPVFGDVPGSLSPAGCEDARDLYWNAARVAARAGDGRLGC